LVAAVNVVGKKTIIVLFLTAFLAAAGFAQDFNNPQIMEKLGLTQEQVTQLTSIHEEAEKIIIEAQLDIDIERAQMKKLLFESNVDLRQVERRLKSILDLEYKLRLAQITREVKARKVIGDKEWARLTQMIRARREAIAREKRQPEPGTNPKPGSKR
jgi:Spy/CpxP family protein refolding chaperone